MRSASVLVVVVLVLPCTALGNITILSEQYHVQGQGCTLWPSGEVPEYDTMATEPVSDSVYGAWSSAGRFYVNASTPASEGWASASAHFVFSIDQPLLMIDIDGYLWSQAFADEWGGISYSLSDVTTGQSIAANSWSLSDEDQTVCGTWQTLCWEEVVDDSSVYTLAVDHDYSLHLDAWVSNADGTTADMSTSVSLVSPPSVVPVPSAILLASCGLGIAGAILRRGRDQHS